MKTRKAILGVLIMFVAASAFASGGDRVDVEVISDRGDRFQLIPHRDFRSGATRTSKSYLEARRGENYTILVRNNLAWRVGVVVAVDGRNIITGRKSFLKDNEMMYIVGPHGEARLDGWRTSSSTVNRFYFTDSPDSYSVRTFGDSSAMGVIAIAVFREKERPVAQLFDRNSSGKAAAPSAPRDSSKEAAGDEAGTGFGNEQHSPAVSVEFEPETGAMQKILIRYEWREELCKKGILQCRPAVRNRLWDADEFAPYPPGYRSR